MNTFKVHSYELQTGKWEPAGTLFRPGANSDDLNIQQREFPPEHRFDTKEVADEFFRNYYLRKGFVEEEN